MRARGSRCPIVTCIQLLKSKRPASFEGVFKWCWYIASKRERGRSEWRWHSVFLQKCPTGALSMRGGSGVTDGQGSNLYELFRKYLCYKAPWKHSRKWISITVVYVSLILLMSVLSSSEINSKVTQTSSVSNDMEYKLTDYVLIYIYAVRCTLAHPNLHQ